MREALSDYTNAKVDFYQQVNDMHLFFCSPPPFANERVDDI